MRSLAQAARLRHRGRYRLVLTRGCGSTLIALFVGQLAGLRAWFGVNRLGRCSLSGGRFGAGCHVRGEWSGVVLRVQLGLEFMKFLLAVAEPQLGFERTRGLHGLCTICASILSTAKAARSRVVRTCSF